MSSQEQLANNCNMYTEKLMLTHPLWLLQCFLSHFPRFSWSLRGETHWQPPFYTLFLHNILLYPPPFISRGSFYNEDWKRHWSITMEYQKKAFYWFEGGGRKPFLFISRFLGNPVSGYWAPMQCTFPHVLSHHCHRMSYRQYRLR